MDILKTYRMQRKYYGDFAFLPIQEVKKHNHFVYKLYAKDHQLYPLFDCVLNKEVLDNHYIVNIHKSIANSSVPQSQAVLNDLEYAGDAVALFFRESSNDHRNLAFVESTIRIVLRSLGNFGEVQKKLTDDLNNLLSGHEFTSFYKTNSEDIANIIDVLRQMCKGIQVSISRLSEFTSSLPPTGKYRQPASMAKYCVNNLIDGLKKWCRVQETIVHQLQGWRSVRVEHERQEVLN